MLSIKNILVATDFSAMSEHAFRFAAAMARDYGARLTVVHVIRPPLVTAVYAETGVFVEEADYTAPREALQALTVPGVTVEHRLLEGEPGPTIVQVARDGHCDLIVMGTHGRTGLMRILMGSVAEEVLRDAPCPVMTVKAGVPIGEPIKEVAREPVSV
jgi:nucleotide-binding universal stress UspA family protein